eukprot:13558107-Alexandrium_andersonii.AAC.1
MASPNGLALMRHGPDKWRTPPSVNEQAHPGKRVRPSGVVLPGQPQPAGVACAPPLAAMAAAPG